MYLKKVSKIHKVLNEELFIKNIKSIGGLIMLKVITKHGKKMISMLIVTSMLLLSTVIANGQQITYNDTVEPESKLSDKLYNLVQNLSENDKIKVWIWYNDIDQNEVDELTEKKTDLTPEKCQFIKEFPSPTLLSSLESEDLSASSKAELEMQQYLERTKVEREKERELTNIYKKSRREISREMYEEKSNVIKDELLLNSEK